MHLTEWADLPNDKKDGPFFENSLNDSYPKVDKTILLFYIQAMDRMIILAKVLIQIHLFTS
jgi:hypothetical protein